MKRSFSARSGWSLYRISIDAMMIAIHVVMGFLPSEFSWQSLPVLVTAFLLSPADAVAVSVIGSFAEQLRYGLGFATVIWMLPWLIFGLLAGFGAYVCRSRQRVWCKVLVIVLSELTLTICNTAALYYFGYIALDLSSVWMVVVSFALRMPQGIIRAVLSSIVIPILLPPLKKTLSMGMQQVSSTKNE